MAKEGGGEEETTAAVGAGDMEGQIVVAEAAYEEVMDGGWGGGGDQFIPPPGFRFRPSDDELVRYYLLPKLQGRAYVPNRAIIEANVYQCHPDQLIGKYRGRGEGNSYYFLSPRERRYDNGLRPRRDTKDGRGRWKVSTGKKDKGGDKDKEKEKKVAGDGMTQYCASVLNYFEGPKCKSDWLMRELTVPGYEIKPPKDGGPGGKTLDRYVMCKIYLKDDKGDDDEEAGPSSASPLHGPVEGDEGPTAAELPKLSKKLAVKRPAEDQQLRNAAAAKKRAHHSRCLQIEPPAPQGNGMQAPFSTPGCYGGSGQPMGYHAGAAPMPRPLLAHNNGQVHVPRQQGAYNGQVLVMTRQPAAYNGQVPVMTRQPAAYSGQMPARQQQVAFNGKVRPPAYRSAGSPSSYGQNLTMMMQPSCPAGQAVNPQMQKQPETDEILEKRVLRQNPEEYLRMQSEIQQRQMGFTQQQQQAMTLTQQQQQQQAMALTQQQQQQQTMPLTQQQQQYAMALTQQQQQKAMALTQQQQQKAMALTHRQQQAMAFMMRQQQQRRMSFMMHQQQQQYSGGANANNYHHAGAMVLPTTSSSPGEAAPVTADGSPVSTVESVEGNEEGNNGDCSNHGREEPAVVKVSPGGATASAEGDGPRHA